MQNSAPFGNLITSAVETVVDKAKRRSRRCVVFFVSGDIPAHADTTIHKPTIKHLHLTTRRRVECGADVPGAGHFSRRGLQASGHSASGRAGTVIDGQNQQIVTQYPRRDHRGWSPHMAASRNKPAKPNPASNRNFIPSGEIGTHAMHPPGKRKHRHQ
jgi:hypothetical protein